MTQIFFLILFSTTSVSYSQPPDIKRGNAGVLAPFPEGETYFNRLKSLCQPRDYWLNEQPGIYISPDDKVAERKLSLVAEQI